MNTRPLRFEDCTSSEVNRDGATIITAVSPGGRIFATAHASPGGARELLRGLIDGSGEQVDIEPKA